MITENIFLYLILLHWCRFSIGLKKVFEKETKSKATNLGTKILWYRV